MYKRLALISIGLFSALTASFAQFKEDPDASGYYVDALRYSQTQPFGTARSQAMGGVNNALGGDLTSLAGNPAGLGVYNRSEMGISTTFGFTSALSNYFNTATKASRGYLAVPNLGIVFTGKRKTDDTRAYRGGSFGIGFTRINNFQNHFRYSGRNEQNSMTDYFLQQVQGIDENKLDPSDNITHLGDLAYWTYLVNPVLDSNYTQQPPYNYYTFNQGYPSKQQEDVVTRGAMNQWNFTYGGNISDQFYIGASLGLPQIRYISEKSYKEIIDPGRALTSFNLNETLKVKGNGINFKIGMILKPVQAFRIGLAIQTPTLYTISEQYSAAITSNFDPYLTNSFPQQKESLNPSLFKYNLTTPFRASGGIAIVAGKTGLISADVEVVPYNLARLRDNRLYSDPNSPTFPGDNNTIQTFNTAVNLNLGGELRFDIFRVRGGFALLGAPYNAPDAVNRKTMNLSLGAGVRVESYYIDVALVNSRTNSVYMPYTVPNSDVNPQVVTTKNTFTNFMISTGFFF